MIANFTNFTMINVGCRQCSNFMFLFATHELTLTNVVMKNISNPDEFSNEGETLSRGGLVGFLHHPLPTTINPKILYGTGGFENVQGAIFKIFVKQDVLAPTYTFDGNSFSKIRINEKGGGVISIFGDTSTALISAIFNNITAFDIKNSPGITDLEGGVFFAKNLKSFIGTTILDGGSGDAFYLVNEVGPSINVTLENNTFI